MRTWAALLVLLLSGCLGSGPTGNDDSGDGGSTGKDPDGDGPLPIGGAARNWTTVELPLGCAYFCEPTVAIDAGGAILVRSGQMAISLDGGASFEPRSPPPLPQAAPPGSFQNDGLVQAGPDGRFYFSALITYYSPELQSIVLDGLQVASSADDAVTWDVDTYLSAATTPQSTGLGADRQWLTFGGPGEVYLGYQQVRAALVYHPTLADPASRVPPPPGEIQVAASQDG